MPRLFVKDETRNPTHSFKDRVVSVALTRAREIGFTTVSCASTGNLANAVAAHAAAAGFRAVIFVPAGLEAASLPRPRCTGRRWSRSTRPTTT